MAGKPRIVLDTNIFINATFAGDSSSARIIRSIENGDLEILVSPALEREYDQQLSPSYIQKRWKHKAKSNADSIKSILKNATSIEPDVKLQNSRDPADNKFLDCAVSGNADYLVSSDDDLLELKYIRDIPILTPGQFLRQQSISDRT